MKSNSMNGSTAAVDIALEEWGKWMRNADKVLGWRSCSLLEKFKAEHAGANQATAPTTIPDGVMNTDAAIAKLGDIRQKVIKITYMTNPNDPKSVQRRRLRMSEYRWNYLLGEARRFVALQLGIPLTERKQQSPVLILQSNREIQAQSPPVGDTPPATPAIQQHTVYTSGGTGRF